MAVRHAQEQQMWPDTWKQTFYLQSVWQLQLFDYEPNKRTDSFHGFVKNVCIRFGVEVDERFNAASVRLLHDRKKIKLYLKKQNYADNEQIYSK